MEEPNPRAPRPSPYPSSRLSDTSFSLEVTPERARGRERKPLRRQAQNETSDPSSTCTVIREPSGNQVQVDDTNAPLKPPSLLLSAPHFNSTTRLYHKLNNFKQHKQPSSSSSCSSSSSSKNNLSVGRTAQLTCAPPTRQCVSSKQSTSSSRSALTSVTDWDEVASTKPLKEVNIPRHKSRYSDLPPVDISNESFERLAFKPRKKEGVKGKGGRKIAASKETTEAPSIVEFFSPDLEWDEADWEWDTNSRSSGLCFATVPSDSAFTLYSLMQSWKH